MKQQVKISKVKGNPNNPRIIKNNKFKKLVTSIKEFPEMLKLRPIVVDEDMMVLGGNMRLRASKDAGLKEVWIEIAEGFTEEQKKEFIVKDNVGFGEWEWDILANEWDSVQLAEWGLDVWENEDDVKEGLIEDDEIPEVKESKVKRGDIWQLGEHRIMCGDSTSSDDVNKLIGEKEPYLMVTDPPYGVNYNPSWRNEALREDGKPIGARAVGKVSNDDNADWREAWSISAAKVAYVWHDGKNSGIVQESLEACDYEIRSQIIWNKSNFAIGRGDYHWKHEPCWYAVKKGSKGNWASDRKQTTVWDIAKPSKSETGHGTQKPVECMSKPIENHDGDVYDPFIGSGTTLIAAEKLNRKCYGMELDEKYCDVIINRWEQFTGLKATIINGTK